MSHVRRVGVAIGAAVLLLVALAPVLVMQSAAASGTATTVVSLTFDDGRATAYNARSILASHGMHGTYYINSPELGTSSFYMTQQQVDGLYADGNEIGGHTAYHANLVKTDPAETARQICYDRNTMLAMGYQPTSFAYPYGYYNAAVESAAQSCGYNSARTTDVVTNYSTTTPPPDPYAIPIGTGSLDLGALEASVSAAQSHGGGWVPLMFHDVCSDCSSISISASDFSSLLDWLQSQAGSGVVVKTVGEVIGGAVHPAVAGPALPPAPLGVTTLHNSSLEVSTDGYTPDCFAQDDYGNNGYTWTRTTDAHSGSAAQRLDVTNFQYGDDKLLVKEDLGACTPTVTAGHQYRMSTWYKSDQPVSFIVDQRGAGYTFSYWTTSAEFPASSTWRQATFVTPAVPAGVTGVAFGLALESNGTMTVDDVGFVDNAGGPADVTPPSVSLTSPASGATLAGSVAMTATASDDVAVDHVDFLVDGVTVASNVTGLTTASWDSRSVPNGSHSVVARAVDTAGNLTTSAPRIVFVSNQNVNLLPNPSLEQASGSTPSCWLLGGYGTNTYAWTRTTDAHTGSYAENLQLSAWSSGDRKFIGAQDSGTCAPSIVAGHSYTVSGWYKGTLPAYVYVYYRTSAGSWVYLEQSGRLPSSSTWTQGSWATQPIPAGATNLSVGIGGSGTGSLTMDDFALVDNTPVPDTTAPTSSIACEDEASEDSCGVYFTHAARVRLSAVDDPGGSGVASIRYTTDGSVPTATNGTTYTGPFSTTTAVKWRAFDNAGNAEAVQRQSIRLDVVAPTSTMTCNGGPCAASSAGVSVALSATDDASGSGVASIMYTTDGTDPSLTSGTRYAGSFSVATTSVIKYRAYDIAGNAEDVHTSVVSIDSLAPTSAIACGGVACSGGFYTGPVVVTLSAMDEVGGSGVTGISYTTDGTAPSATNGTTYTGPFTVSATTSIGYSATDGVGNREAANVAEIRIDGSPPVTTAMCDGTPCVSAPYVAHVSLSLTADDGAAGSGVAFTRYTTDGTDPTATAGQLYVAPFDVTEATTVKFRSFDAAGNAEQVRSLPLDVTGSVDSDGPSTVVTCGGSSCGAGYYSAPVTVAVAAADGPGGSGVASVVYTTDGTDPTHTNGSDYTVPLVLTATTTIKARAYDTVGNAGPVTTARIQIDVDPPTVGATCDGDSCAETYYAHSVSVALPSSDAAAGSGVASVRYTTDGSDPSAAHGAVYAGSFSVPLSTTVKYLAFDLAGNASPIGTVTVLVDTTSPTSAISCNGAPCSTTFYGTAVSLGITAVDGSGSGVAHVRYTTDGSDPTADNGVEYTQAVTFDQSATVKYRAYDSVGNAEPVNTISLSIDVTPPTTSVACNGSPCSAGYYASTVAVSLTATDGSTGSGVAATRYTTDGSTPTSTTGQVYSRPFNVPATATVRFRSFDKVGNVEAARTTPVQIDTVAPTAALTAPTGGSLVSGTVALAATATDNIGVDHVDFLVDGALVGTATQQPFGYNWASASIADGVHVLTARSVDGAGNTTTSAPVAVTVANINLIANPSLETASGSTPSCWLLGGYGTNTFAWSRVTDAHSGTYGESLSVTGYTSGDRKFVTAQDSGSCAPAVSSGNAYTMTAWYKSTAHPYFFVYYRTTSGWVYWTGSAPLPTAASWSRTTFTTPSIPAGATNISFGLGLDAVGTLTVDDFGLYRLR